MWFETEHSPGLRCPGPCQWAGSASAGEIWWVRSMREPIRQRMESRSHRPQGNASALGPLLAIFAEKFAVKIKGQNGTPCHPLLNDGGTLSIMQPDQTVLGRLRIVNSN